MISVPIFYLLKGDMVVAQRDLEKHISVMQDLLQVYPIGGGGPMPCTSWFSFSKGVIEEIWA